MRLNTAVEANSEPMTSIVTGKSVPAITLLGEMESSVGTGYVPTFTVKFTTFEEFWVG